MTGRRVTKNPAEILRGFLLALAAIAWGGPAFAAPEGSRFNRDYFANAEVVTHNGERVPFYDALIKGKRVVINFMYLTCKDICPLTTSRVAEIYRRLGEAVGRDVFIYSISMDPENDTPELLKLHADAFEAGDGWLFLTGEPETIRQLRWKLGERSRNLTEHRNDLVLGNDVTGEWSRTSVYSDIEVSVAKIRELDPGYFAEPRAVSSRETAAGVYRLDKQTGQALFIKACSTCHSIGGGDRVGPDLKDVARRRAPEWLRRFLMAPDSMRAEGDPLSVALADRYPGVVMPNLGLKENDVADVLAYIESRSRAADGTASSDSALAAGAARQR